jgi:hypothetical protein
MMMSRLMMILGLAGVITLSAPSPGQEAASAGSSGAATQGAQITYTYDHPQMSPSHYVIVINENGHGHYQSALNPEAPVDPQNRLVTQPLDRDITVSGKTLDLLFSTARRRKLFAIPCENGTGKVAFRGNQELSYQGSEGQGSCKFNWSKDPQIEKVSETLQSMAFTLEEGGRLALEYRHDRLALDAELDMLVKAAKEDRAAEIQNIAPQLEQIGHDEQVLARARQRANELLKDAAAQ